MKKPLTFRIMVTYISFLSSNSCIRGIKFFPKDLQLTEAHSPSKKLSL